MNMLTSLDLLVIVFLVLGALTVLALSLMLLIKNKTARKVFFFIVSVLSLYICSIGLRSGISGMFVAQIIVGILTVLMTVGAFVLERVSKGNEKMFLFARVLATAALVLGFLNAIF